MKLSPEFYRRSNTISIARELLGKVLVTSFNRVTTSGIITETEAYLGVIDKASHAWNGRFTQRTRIMYENGGISYVYLCYGIHHLFNVVTHAEGQPHAVLIRSVKPLDGIPHILKRRKSSTLNKNITTGPGKVSAALGIKTSHTGLSLNSNRIWIEDRGIKIKSSRIITTPRIGVDYAGEDAKLPYRFFVSEM